jgi:cytochrome c biogenesis factor
VSTIDFLNLGIGLAALTGGLTMLFVALKRHKRDHPKGVALLIAGMMVTAFGLFITAFAIAFAFGEPMETAR